MSAESLLRRVASLLMAICAIGTIAFSEEPTVLVHAPDAALSVGDPLHIRVEASGGEDGFWGDLSLDLGKDEDWAVIEGPKAIPDATSPAWDVTLAPLKLGELPLPTFSLRWRDQDSKARSITPEEVPKITVASVISPDDKGKAAALKDPLGVKGFPWEWILPISVVLLLLVALIFLSLRLRRRKAKDDAEVPALPPFEEIRRALTELEGGIGRETADGICDRLAFILRRYLERRSGEPAAEMTSSELRILARELHWPSDSLTDLQKTMLLLDAVRFARRPVTESELREAVSRTRTMARSLEKHYLPLEEDVAA